MARGGYLIVDFIDTALSLTENVSIPGIYERFEGNVGKVVMVCGVSFDDGTETVDQFIQPYVDGTSIVFSFGEYLFKINDDDTVSVSDFFVPQTVFHSFSDTIIEFPVESGTEVNGLFEFITDNFGRPMIFADIVLSNDTMIPTQNVVPIPVYLGDAIVGYQFYVSTFVMVVTEDDRVRIREKHELEINKVDFTGETLSVGATVEWNGIYDAMVYDAYKLPIYVESYTSQAVSFDFEFTHLESADLVPYFEAGPFRFIIHEDTIEVANKGGV